MRIIIRIKNLLVWKSNLISIKTLIHLCETNVWLISILMIKKKFRTNDYIASVIRQDDFQSGNHKDKSSQREIMKKKTTSKRSVF